MLFAKIYLIRTHLLFGSRCCSYDISRSNQFPLDEVLPFSRWTSCWICHTREVKWDTNNIPWLESSFLLHFNSIQTSWW